MQTVLFTFPLKPGKLEAYNAFFKEISGPRKEEYADLLNRYGLNNVKVWHRKFGDTDYVLFIHDMEDDGMERLKGWSSSTHPFDLWFNEQLMNCYDMKSADDMPEQPEFLYKFDARS